MDDSPQAIAHDIARIARISVVPSLLRIVCDNSGMRFAAVARVTDGTWTACAVQDDLQFGLAPGGQLDVHTTLCKEARSARQTVVFDHASQDPTYCKHHTPRIYNIESYISAPIVRANGEYFGNLCAIDPEPHPVSDPKIVAMFERFAELIGRQLDLELHHEETEHRLIDAQANAELREQFIAVLGHDLRNPLASVGAIGEILARGPAPDVARYGQRIKASTQRMSGLINDVLDLARGRLGSAMLLRCAPIADLQSVLRHVVAELRETHPSWTITEHYTIGSDGIAADLGRLQQLLSNLLANALTYGTPSEPIRVHASLDADGLTLSVRNAGTPIPPANLDRIFEPYWRPADSKPGGGLGLGLHICAQIVQAHGGTLKVSSTLEHGTCFTARLPAHQDASTSA